MQLSFTQKKHIRRNFGKLVEGLSIPNLIGFKKTPIMNFLSQNLLINSLVIYQKELTKFSKVFFRLKMEMISQL